MYRITVTTTGKYHNVVTGTRYCFSKKSIKEMVDLFSESKCVFNVEKLVWIFPDVFVWSNHEEGDSVFQYFHEKEYENNI